MDRSLTLWVCNRLSGTEAFGDIEQGNQPAPPQQENVQHKVAHKRMQETKAQIDEVTGILKKNVDLILQRDEKLSDLDDRADALKDEASEFGKQTGKLKRKYWWKNCKMLAILIGICFVVIIIIIVWAVSVES
ncbi:vesicle-associated membrane protein 3 [Trichonephila inaurata madagascariensis]|uniref:Vesicle-associated membrane protein 3 n=1 Tax=Trichonephila inaurata madagascariensis TaxID=2747483 RepID=A0A8X6I839_9ARAC|nr:vesicle-associated membrane protein 3 [Trichonephila inaurata madagascariensis]